MNKFKNHKFQVYLGKCKNTGYKIYLNGFSWNCNWYYGGGYLNYNFKNGKQAIHTHFDIVFLKEIIKDNKPAVWFDLKDLVDDAQFDSKTWWRIKDLYKQFYILQDCAEVFQYGGHCTDYKRSKREIKKSMANKINNHIEKNIIREIKKILRVKL
jgi:hypothetical protein